MRRTESHEKNVAPPSARGESVQKMATVSVTSVQPTSGGGGGAQVVEMLRDVSLQLREQSDLLREHFAQVVACQRQREGGRGKEKERETGR